MTMKLKHFLVCASMAFFCVLSALTSCGSRNSDEKNTAEEDSVPMCSCPHAVICIQPYGNYTKQEASRLLPVLEENFGKWMYGGWQFKVLEPKPLPEEAYVKERDRYRAGAILQELSKNPKKVDGMDAVYIGIAHKDICTDIHNTKNYGIMGLSYCPGNVCVVSDHRIKAKSMVWKLMLHEFCHAFYGAKHCPNDDPKCFMKDAKGKGNVEVQNWLCDSCKR